MNLPSGVPLTINGNWLYQSPDGREAWVMFDRARGLAFIVTDIHGNGQPENAVGFSPAILRAVADELETS